MKNVFAVGFLFLATLLPAHALEIPLEKAPKVKKQPAPKFDATKPLFLDARPLFDYSTVHLAGALNIRWDDYAQTEEATKGLLDADLQQVTHRLTSLGVHPDRVTFVFGKGAGGKGEEGRVAWMLEYLGVKDVRVFTAEGFLGKKHPGEQEQTIHAPFWKPTPQESLRIRRAELKTLVQSKDPSLSIIDVRESNEFKVGGHIVGSVNIPFRTFFDDKSEFLQGPDVRALFGKNKVDVEKTLIFVSQKGVRSAFATYIAHHAGLKSKNFDGGLQEWKVDSSVSLVK